MYAKELDLTSALRDIREGWRWRELWLTLGWRDILNRHRRSFIGPFWITISMALVAAGLGVLYSAIMNAPPEKFIPYLVGGFIAWGLLISMVNEGKDAFVANAAAIREIPVPLTIYVYRVLWRNVLVLSYNLIVYVGVVALFGIQPFPAVFLFIPALAIALVNGLWIGIFVGLINARFRDLGQMIPQAMRLLFFITPIIWFREAAVGARALFVHLNPLFYYVEMLRAPLLGQVPEARIWIVVLVLTAIGWALAIPAYAYWRRQIPFWI